MIDRQQGKAEPRLDQTLLRGETVDRRPLHLAKPVHLKQGQDMPRRNLAAAGTIEAYDLERAFTAPPAAVIFDYRLGLYLEQFPRLAAYVTRHYVPWYRNLWLPGLGALTKKGVTRVDWTVQHAGEYELFASESLVGHPWFTHPFDYARAAGPTALQLAIPLRRLSKLPRSAIRVTVDGRIVDALEPLVLKRGGRVEIVITSDRDAAVLLVPHGIDVLGLAPAEEFVF